jgi:hypothetical protein
MVEPDDEYDDDEPRPLGAVLAKVGAVVVGIGVLVAIGTIVMVKALGLNTTSSGGPATSDPVAPVSPLPSSALPVPGSSDSSSSQPSSLPSPKASKKLQLNVTPVFARPMERVNLTGSYPGHDAVSLQVQRFQNGQWTDFSGVTASVNLGTFQTFVMTGQAGDNKFRVFDPQSQIGSNPVTVTIG